MKKIILFLISISIFVITFTGCNKRAVPTEDNVGKAEQSDQVEHTKEKVDLAKQEAEAAKKQSEIFRTNEILAKLKKIPVSEYRKNYLLYQELVALHPENERYLIMMKFYERERTETEIILAKLKRIPVIEYRKNYDLYKRLLEIHPDNKYYKDKMEFYADKLHESSTDGCINNGEIIGKTLTLTVHKCKNGARFEASNGAVSKQFSKKEIKKIKESVSLLIEKGYHGYRDKEKLYRKPGISIYTKLYSEEHWYMVFAFNSIHESPPNASIWIVHQDLDRFLALIK